LTACARDDRSGDVMCSESAAPSAEVTGSGDVSADDDCGAPAGMETTGVAS
jgi:hypothetical protein